MLIVQSMLWRSLWESIQAASVFFPYIEAVPVTQGDDSQGMKLTIVARPYSLPPPNGNEK